MFCKSLVKQFEKAILLQIIDDEWKENLRNLDELKHSVQTASYEQKDPLVIFKLESATLFDTMINKIYDRVVSILMRCAAHAAFRQTWSVPSASTAPDELPAGTVSGAISLSDNADARSSGDP